MVPHVGPDPLRGWSIRRCPRSNDCPSSLCPLDPELRNVDPPGEAPLCHWYTISGRPEAFNHVPEFLWRPLLAYTLYLLEKGIQRVGEVKIPP